jgi:soluble lytic murein transglycosylase-like protein
MIELFTAIANQVGVSASLLISVCAVETNLRNVNNFGDANGRGSLGLCQVSVDAAKSVAPHLDGLALQQNAVNVKVAAMYLKKLENKYLFDELVIASFNAGSPRYTKSGKLRNKLYVDKVLALRESKYKELQ